ncbi:MAG: LysR substrate-binding domain-containing protein [Mesorhizobium sp.]|nr:LysR substrate-binding domain-containing protein [Mesorhizobium sp.]
METLRHLIPSINGLVVFEAAGRLASFSAAARELGMTQAAVSYAIGRLEAQLATALFLREHRRVRLTAAGQRFHADVSLGLSHIQRSAQGLRAVAAGAHVTLSASTAFAAFWMVPRLQRFREDLPDIDLRIQTADRDLDLVGEGIPLGIREGGLEDWPHYACEILAPEEIYPVCGASYVARFGRPASLEDLLSHRLIHHEEPFRATVTWNEWFASAGMTGRPAPKGLQINDYVAVIQSVIEGQGIALGWGHLTDGLVEKGVLLRLTDHSLATGKNFHVAWPRDKPLSPAASQVRDWMTDPRNR